LDIEHDHEITQEAAIATAMVLIKPKIEDALLLNKDKKAKKLDFDHTRFKRYSYHF